jgi:pyridoxine 5-phosphate synthase
MGVRLIREGRKCRRNCPSISTSRHRARSAQDRSTRIPLFAAGLAELAALTHHLPSGSEIADTSRIAIWKYCVKRSRRASTSKWRRRKEMIRTLAKYVRTSFTLVPERPEEITTEGGLNINHSKEAIRTAANLLHEHEIELSIFIDPVLDQVKAARDVGAKVVEINTGRYCEAMRPADVEKEFRLILDAMRMAEKLRLEVAAGHGLHYKNNGYIAAIRRCAN